MSSTIRRPWRRTSIEPSRGFCSNCRRGCDLSRSRSCPPCPPGCLSQRPVSRSCFRWSPRRRPFDQSTSVFCLGSRVRKPPTSTIAAKWSASRSGEAFMRFATGIRPLSVTASAVVINNAVSSLGRRSSVVLHNCLSGSITWSSISWSARKHLAAARTDRQRHSSGLRLEVLGDLRQRSVRPRH